MKASFFVTLSVSAIMLLSCSDQPKAGGNCDYDIKTVPATVIAVLPSEDGESAEVLFEVSTADGKTDTLYFSKQFGSPAYSEDLIGLDLHIGNALQCEHKVRKTGTCDPEIFVLKRDTYK